MRPLEAREPRQPPSSGGQGVGAPGGTWAKRAGRLYVDLERPARAMVRRAFRGAFSDDELDDIYAAAWLGTLRALGRRHAELSDDEIRRYLLAAVANQASKELRRRRRKPTAPLDQIDAVDERAHPDERAVGAERSRMARDLLASLPPRRRAVMLLRYGWGLEPRQVCELVRLSPRAYRKEITRGVEELTQRMHRLEQGEWCAERGTVLKAYATGLADAEERRQAEAHLAHCRACGDFVARIRGRLHDIGAGAALPVSLEALRDNESLAARIAELGGRARETLEGLVVRGSEGVHEAIGGLAGAGGTRGMAGATGAGLLAKLAQLGTAGKVAVVCVTGGAVATACVGSGAVPGLGPSGAVADRERAAPLDPDDHAAGSEPVPAPAPPAGQGAAPSAATPDADPAREPGGETAHGGSTSGSESAGAPSSDLEFGVTGAGARAAGAEGSPRIAAGTRGSGSGSGDGEFGLDPGHGGVGKDPAGGTRGEPAAQGTEFVGP